MRDVMYRRQDRMLTPLRIRQVDQRVSGGMSRLPPNGSVVVKLQSVRAGVLEMRCLVLVSHGVDERQSSTPIGKAAYYTVRPKERTR